MIPHSKANTPAGIDAPATLQEWQFHHTPWEPEFLARFGRHVRIVRIACPFIKLRNIRLLLSGLPMPNGPPPLINIVTRLNKRDCRSYVHDLSALSLLMHNPVPDRCHIRLRINNALHAKCYIFDDSEVIITSSNLTFAAFHRNVEMALATGKSDIVATASQYFDHVFDAATPATEEMLESVKAAVYQHPGAYDDIVGTEDNAAIVLDALENDDTTTEQEEPVSADPATVEAIDAAMNAELDRDVAKQVVLLMAVSPENATEQTQREEEFLAAMSHQVRAVFGGESPTATQVASIFTHRSAIQMLHAAKPDPIYAESLELIGTYVLNVLVASILVKGAGGTYTKGDLQAKVNHICGSDLLNHSLASRGLARVLLSASLSGMDNATLVARRRALRTTAHALVGFLFTTRPWKQLELGIGHLLDIEGSFPLESYRCHNYKRELQQHCQAEARTDPTYDVVSKEGPDHNTLLTVQVRVGKRVIGSGSGVSRKAAEMQAAFEALKQMRVEPQRKVYTTTWLLSEVVQLCRQTGAEVIRDMSGQNVRGPLLLAALLPPGHGRSRYSDIREGLVVLGASVRNLAACLASRSGDANRDTMTKRIAVINSKEHIINAVKKTPLWKWLDTIQQEKRFASAETPSAIVETLNACLGAVFLEGGLEPCIRMCLRIFADPPTQPENPARSRLQALVQAHLGMALDEVVRFDCTSSGKPHELVHKAKAYVSGVKTGEGEGATKRVAIEAACEVTLHEPLLQQLLEKEAAKHRSQPSQPPI